MWSKRILEKSEGLNINKLHLTSELKILTFTQIWEQLFHSQT